ncbi:MAG: VCBS repeat-containing protein [Saprospiraceae bacterium]|nr:VCBS repeat-containing protein [Saprospiraceae bacterium]
MISRVFFTLMGIFLAGTAIAQLSFAPPKEISGGTISGISALDVADFNTDGLMDVVLFEGGAHAEGRNTLAWLEQKHSGKWVKHDFEQLPNMDDFIGSAKCGDVDNDGDPDVVFSNDGHSSGPVNVYVLENNVNQPEKIRWTVHLISTIEGFHANDMRLADIDRDGKMDVVLRHKAPESLKVIFQNRMDQWSTKTISTGQAGEGLAVGDLNADGLIDISMTGHWYLTPSDARSGTYKKYDIDGGYKMVNKATKESTGDIDGDGRLDIVLSPAEHFKKYGGDNHDLAWYRCPRKPKNKSRWKKFIIKSNYNKAHCAKLADFDNDGDLDILSAIAWDDREIIIYLNDHGTFDRSIQVVSGKGIYSGAVADMDGDGDLDIIGEEKYSKDGHAYYYENLLIK